MYETKLVRGSRKHQTTIPLSIKIETEEIYKHRLHKGSILRFKSVIFHH